tara:strand:+ start:279 stop:2726 length:2448 start_codon:yes stop_codon:yes gene_type:complete
MLKKILIPFLLFFSFVGFTAPTYSKNGENLGQIDDFISYLISNAYYDKDGLNSNKNIHTSCLNKEKYNLKLSCVQTKLSDRRNYFIGKMILKHKNVFFEEDNSRNTERFIKKTEEIIQEIDKNYELRDFFQNKLFTSLKKNFDRNQKRVSLAFAYESKSLSEFNLSLSSIIVKSDVEKAEVYLDGKYLGKTPLFSEKIVPKGTYSLRLTKSFLSASLSIKVNEKNEFIVKLKNSNDDVKAINKLVSEFDINEKKLSNELTIKNLKKVIGIKKKSKNFIKDFKSLQLDNEESKLRILNEYIAEYDEDKINNISKELLSNKEDINDLLKSYEDLEKIDSNFGERNLIKVSFSGREEDFPENDIKASYFDKNNADLLVEQNGFYLNIASDPVKIDRDVISESERIGKYLSGTIQRPNGSYVTAKTNHDIAYNNYIIAKRKAENASRACYEQGSFLEQVLCGTIISGLASGSEARAYEKAKRTLNNTPPYVSEKVYKDYVYVETVVKAKKNQKLKIDKLNLKTKKIEEGIINFNKEETFYLYNGLHPEEKKPPKKQNTQGEIDEFLIEKESSLKVSTILSKFEKSKDKKISSFTSLNEIDFLKKNINPEKKVGFFNNLISFFWNSSSNLKDDQKEESDLENQIDRRFESVVQIKTLDGSLGTGFYVKNNLIVTNQHVVGGNSSVDIINFYKEKFIGEVIKVDRYRDLALINVSNKGLPVKIFNKSFLKLGSEVEALGHPEGFDYSLSRGIVSSTRKITPPLASVNLGEVEYIQTDTDVNPGNSGGPLFHNDNVVGVNTFGNLKGLNFAVSYKELIKFID